MDHSVSVLRHRLSTLYALRYSKHCQKGLVVPYYKITRSVRCYLYSCVTSSITFITKGSSYFRDPPPHLQPTTKSHRLRNIVIGKHTGRQILWKSQAPTTISDATKE